MSFVTLLKKYIPQKMKYKARYILNKNSNGQKLTKKEKINCLLKNYFLYSMYSSRNYSKRLNNIYKKFDFKNCFGFIYSINEKTIFYNYDSIYSNGTVDYSLVVNYSLLDLAKKTEGNLEMHDLYSTIISIIKRITKDRNDKYSKYLRGFITSSSTCLEDALQRILFINQILWQTNHCLVGLGRLDKVLDKYSNEQSEEDAINIICNFLNSLHNDYKYKSNLLFGDTGQIIVLGGLSNDGSYFCNRLTYCFIKALSYLRIPDPKLLLRVSSKMPYDLLKTAIEAIQTGIGSPLLSNDDIIINRLIDFGYKEKDAYNYITSACWEPFPGNNAIELNNMACFNFLTPLIETIFDPKLDNSVSYNGLFNAFLNNLNDYSVKLSKNIFEYKHGKDLVSSCFKESCVEKNKTIDEGGADYYNFGVTSVGLGNVVDSFLAIKNVVYDQKMMTLLEFTQKVKKNYDDEQLLQYIKNNCQKYGSDDDEVINLSNTIIRYTKEFISTNDKENIKIKFGLSSPDYIEKTSSLMATPDGRKFGEPANVHISSSKSIPYTELVNFASRLECDGKCINGNVVDFFVSPYLMMKNTSKFVDFIIGSIKNGFYQMQMNVVSSKTLIAAKNNPELFPNLIVRVWGFSAYFVDLPDDYKDYLIERAVISERVC